LIRGGKIVRRIRVYVDTSVFGGVEDEEFDSASRQFFNRVLEGRYAVLVSETTLDELDGAPAPVRNVLRDLPAETVEEVALTDEVSGLAMAYIEAGVLKATELADALHVAVATVARADLILSWNFKHLVNYDRIQKFNGVNTLNGYPRIEIHSPLEMDDEDEE
jgi:predicted nucleic acid-binding protein